jgi:N-methylhydantoinase A
VPLAEIVVRHEVDLLFRGQSHVFRVPVTAPDFDPCAVLADFIERYKARFDIELRKPRSRRSSPKDLTARTAFMIA